MKKTVLLYSGGMDSWLIDHIEKPDIRLYLDVNSEYSQEEIKRLSYDKSEHKSRLIIDRTSLKGIGIFARDSDAILPFRNAYMVLAAANRAEDEWPLEKWFEHGVDQVEIILGATAGDRVLDKSQYFCDLMTSMLTYLNHPQHWTGGHTRSVTVTIPFKTMTKTQILAEYVEKGGDLDTAWSSTYSCYHPAESDGLECWQCKPCFRKYVAFALNGYDFEHKASGIEYLALNYIMAEIWPQIKAGKYGRATEEREIRSVLKMKGVIE